MPTEYFQHRSSGDPNLAGIANQTNMAFCLESIAFQDDLKLWQLLLTLRQTNPDLLPVQFGWSAPFWGSHPLGLTAHGTFCPTQLHETADADFCFSRMPMNYSNHMILFDRVHISGNDGSCLLEELKYGGFKKMCNEMSGDIRRQNLGTVTRSISRIMSRQPKFPRGQLWFQIGHAYVHRMSKDCPKAYMS